MPSTSQEKRPSEIISLGADFAQALLLGEIVLGSNVSVTVKNLLTDANATSTILVLGSVVTSGSVVQAQFQAGTAGDLYEVLFSTGATSFGNNYSATDNLIVTNSPVGDNLLTTLDETKLYLDIDPDDHSDDVLITDLISQATRYIQSRTARTLFFQQFTEDIYIDQDEGNCDWGWLGSSSRIQVWEYPLVKIDSITLTTADMQFITSVTDSASWGFTEEGDVFFRHSYGFYTKPEGFNRVVYRAGYARIPDDLRQAAQAVAAVFYRGIGQEGLTGEKIGDYAWQAKAPSTGGGNGVATELSDAAIEGVIRRYTRVAILRA